MADVEDGRRPIAEMKEELRRYREAVGSGPFSHVDWARISREEQRLEKAIENEQHRRAALYCKDGHSYGEWIPGWRNVRYRRCSGCSIEEEDTTWYKPYLPPRCDTPTKAKVEPPSFRWWQFWKWELV